MKDEEYPESKCGGLKGRWKKRNWAWTYLSTINSPRSSVTHDSGDDNLPISHTTRSNIEIEKHKLWRLRSHSNQVTSAFFR